MEWIKGSMTIKSKRKWQRGKLIKWPKWNGRKKKKPRNQGVPIPVEFETSRFIILFLSFIVTLSFPILYHYSSLFPFLYFNQWTYIFFPFLLSYFIFSSVNKPNLPCGFVPTRNGFPSPRVRAEAKGPARRVAAGCGAGEGVLLWGN